MGTGGRGGGGGLGLTMEKKEDRVPPFLRELLNLDVKYTKKFVDGVEKLVPSVASANGKLYMKALEISCHGVPWIACTLISIYMLTSIESREVEINLLLGLIYDVMLVAFIKAVSRRTRPSGHQDKEMFMFVLGSDKFSFPSGHASRAIWIALFFTEWATPGMPFLLKVVLHIWAGSVCVSRVLLRRHHLLDVAAGVGLGFLEFLLSGILWVGPAACKVLGDWIGTFAEDEFDGS